VARRRFFVDEVRNGVAELRGEDARHLSRVLRAEPGQKYEISDGGCAWLAEISEARGDRVVFRIVEPVASPELPVSVTLLAALIKFDRFEWMIEKATELGVSRIVPVEAARSEKGLFEASQKRAERWMRIAREAGQQSRRLRAPEILPAVRLQAALAESADHRYWLEEETAPALFRLLPESRLASARVAMVVGPEGGWTDTERRAAGEAGWVPVSLGPLVLRAETATAAALAILVNAWCS
jgi:16S rRNA (uracil1498-N3)-methyltransferase